MRIDIHIHHHNEETLMAVSQQVADLIAQVKANTSLEQSADLALKALSGQITDLGTQIAALQLQIANGGSLHPDDIAALAAAQADLAASAVTLRTDIPANATPSASGYAARTSALPIRS